MGNVLAPAELDTKRVHTLYPGTVTKLSHGLIRIAENTVDRDEPITPGDLVRVDFKQIINTCLNEFTQEERAQVIVSTDLKDLIGKALPDKGYFMSDLPITVYESPFPRKFRVREFKLVYYRGLDQPHISYWENGYEKVSSLSRFFREPIIMVSSKDSSDPKQLANRIHANLQDKLVEIHNTEVIPQVEKEKRKRHEKYKERFKSALIGLAGNVQEVLKILTKKKLVYYHGSEYGDELNETVFTDSNRYISNELIRLNLVTRIDDSLELADNTRIIGVGFWRMYLARKVYKNNEQGSLTDTNLYTLSDINDPDNYISELQGRPSARKFMIINDGVNIYRVKREIRLARKRYERSVAQSISEEVLKYAGEIVVSLEN